MTVRVFGTNTCNKCKAICKGLDAIRIPYNFIDADADENQDICDRFFVDCLPHVQLIDDKGDIVWQQAERVTLYAILAKLLQLKKPNETK